jgi:ribosome-associated heat shock protein Hsp15
MVRIDKWLWAVRIFKTRGLSTEECKKGHVLVNGMVAKPSKEIKENDHVTVRKLPVLYSYIVKETIDKRVSATKVTECMEDLTTLEELDKLKIKETLYIRRDRGTGRPTKKDRRLINDLEETLFD